MLPMIDTLKGIVDQVEWLMIHETSAPFVVVLTGWVTIGVWAMVGAMDLSLNLLRFMSWIRWRK